MSSVSSKLLLLLLALKYGVFFVPSQSFPNNEVSALEVFKRAIFDDPWRKLSDWDSSDGHPCKWSGVVCSGPQNGVITLNLSSSSLKGFLPPELGLLNSLQEIILDNNLLLGSIPKEIGKLKSLRVLDLSMNRLSGSIPPEIGNLTSITKMDLHSNGFSGTIPPEIGNLAYLAELRFDRNRFNGLIPGSNDLSSSSSPKLASQRHATGLCQLSQLKTADFSFNYFVGKIPTCLKNLPRSSFQGNCLRDKSSVFQRSTEKCSDSASEEGTEDMYWHSNEAYNHRRQKQPEWLLILEIVTGALMVVFFISASATAVKICKPKSAFIIPWKRSTNWKDPLEILIDGEMLKNAERISRLDLEVACEDFSNIIGSYQDTIVYKGTMKGGPEIAVVSLCIPEGNWTRYHEFLFQNKVADFARVNHENIAKLLGYCKEDDPFTRMLVFEYASNGTLYEYLHYGEECQLSWFRRMKIVIGIARGLRYLHTELDPPFTISDLNSTTVYLTDDFSPKLVDFERWKMVFSKSGKTSSSFYSFMDSVEQQHLDVQGNTFAFGVLLLEIISGRPPYCKDRGSLVNWAIEYLQLPEEIDKLVDPELKNVMHDDLAVICSVVNLCIDPDPTKRPSMQIICSALENGMDISPASILKDSSLPWAELALST